jgi:carboxynorspermidine decarboxylase
MNQLNIEAIKARVDTPAFVIDTAYITRILENLKQLRQQSGCKVLYSIKSLPLEVVLNQMSSVVDGFSVSALFEARFAHELSSDTASLHLTTPGLRADEILELGQLCRYISFNSLGQFQRLAGQLPGACSPGLRINPGLSFIEDNRYDPCRQNSKLGVPLQEAIEHWPKGIKGLHFHTVFGSQDFTSLVQTVELIENKLHNYLANLDWINLGGGYLFHNKVDTRPLINLVKYLREQYAVDVFIEPGNALVGQAGYLVATVIDLFNRDGKEIAVLDTSINHNPEVFEYQKPPTLYEHDAAGAYSVILAGSTCLAGDLFGEYRFTQPLKLDDRVIFTDVGSYSLIKANRFNGYNLPDIYSFESNELTLIKRYSYQNYQQQWLSD